MINDLGGKSTSVSRVVAVGGGLLAFGVAFDRFTGWFSRRAWGGVGGVAAVGAAGRADSPGEIEVMSESSPE